MSGGTDSEVASEREVGELLEAAEAWAIEAGELVLGYYGGRLAYEDKLDGTPVTAADRRSEEMLRECIATRFPNHAVLGEEYGESNPGARVRWVLDPVDATRSFMRGVPLFGVLIGIEVAGEPVVGIANFPALGEIVAAGLERTEAHLALAIELLRLPPVAITRVPHPGVDVVALRL